MSEKTKDKTKRVARAVGHGTKRAVKRSGRRAKKLAVSSVAVAKKVPNTRVYKKSKHIVKKTTISSARVAKKVPNTRVYKKTKQVAKKTHHVTMKRPHEKLMTKSKKYAWWHTWQYKKLNHKHVHGVAVIAGGLLVVFLVSSSVPSASALSTWSQSDWSGGVGTNPVNQYSTISNIEHSTTGQITLVRSANEFANPSLTTGANSWDGTFNSHDTSKGYNALGSAKIVSLSAGANLFSGTESKSINQPYLLASEDFNNDGYKDVASITGKNNHKVSVVLSDGSGDYEPANDYDINSGIDIVPSGIAIADFNADGSLDIAAQQGRVYQNILLNNGNGTFAPNNIYPATYPLGITVGDYNNDGKIDLVTSSNYFGGVLEVRYGNNSGAFPTYYSHTIGASAGGMKMDSQDLNKDGRDDIITADGTSVGVMLSNGASFNGIVNYTTQTSKGMALGDINNDGYMDIVVTGATATQLLLNNGSGGFSPAAAIASLSGIDASQVAITDLNGDDWQDIVVLTASGFSYIINDQAGSFGSAVGVASPSFHSLISSDLNNDNKNDIILGDASANNFTIFMNGNGGSAFVQNVDLDDTSDYRLEAYAYTDGSAVTANDAELFVAGKAINTTITPTQKSGWYKLSGKAVGKQNKTSYGVQVKQGKTVYVDDLDLYKYADSGSLTSVIHDLGFGGDWGTLSYITNNPSSTVVKVRTSNDPNMNGASDFAGCPNITSESDLTGKPCINDNDRYVQYQVSLNKDDGNTPIFEDINIQYSAWDINTPDVNASNIAMKKQAGGDVVDLNGWTNGDAPYFEWSSASDNAGGSGIRGYCLYLGPDGSADPKTTKGLLGSSPLDTNGACNFAVTDTNVDLGSLGYISTSLSTSNSPYYLNIKAIDNAGNVFAGANTQFQFRFDNTKPSNPAFVSAPSEFVSNKLFTFTWPTVGNDAPSDDHSGLSGLQYRIGANGQWRGDGDAGAGLLANDGSYTTRDNPDFADIHDGNNVFYFRTVDQAGNVSNGYASATLKLNTGSPSSPQNVMATPITNTQNSFAFTWDAPNSFVGDANNLTYCYTVNTLPTENTCTYTSAGVTSLPAGAYATQPGENTFYVVAKDNNINYATAASITFTANTSAPGMPLDLEVADVSTKATSTWRLALSWNAPTNAGAGVANYRIYRSTDNNTFAQIASTSGTSHVDSGLSQTTYYYKIRACDSANNCGAFSQSISKLPTGRFTTAANMTAQPLVSGVSTKKATVRWSTDRLSDSKILIGTKSGAYEPFQIASAEQVTDHVVELANLTPGTTYFAKATWTDEDGNTGLSSEFSFKTEAAPSTQEVITQQVGLASAQVRFTSVSAAKVVVQYGKTDSFGGVKEIATSLSKSTYTVELTGLDDGTKYLYRLNTFDAEGNEYAGSTVLSFTTPARPRISNLRFQPVQDEPTSTQKVTWTTNVPSSSFIRFSSEGIPTKELSQSKLVTEHEIIIRDLLDNTKYSLVAESRDEGGNLAVSDIQTLRTALDTRPPKISDVIVETTIRGTGAEARGQIVVSWKTDEPATSQVAYGEGSQLTVFNNRTAEDSSLATEHIVIVSDLPTSRVYSVQPVSEDRGENSGTGEIKSAIIGKASDSVLTIVLDTLKKVFGF